MGSFMKGIKFMLRDFSCWTSTHGVPHIGMANTTWLRIFWAIVTLISLGLFIWQLYMLFNKYFSFDVNTATVLLYSERVFPTVTMCNLNPWKKDESAFINPEMNSLINAYEATSTASTQFNWGAGLSGARQQQAAKFTSLMNEELYKASLVPGSDHAYSYSDLVISCTYNAITCNETDFTDFYDRSFGICQSYNYAGQYSSSRAGPLYGLRMVLRTDQSQYLPWTETSGLVVTIHTSDEVPFPDVVGYFAAPGTSASMGVRFLATQRMPSPYGSCTTQTNANEAHYVGPYEVEACFRSCLQEQIVKKCGCYDPAYSHAANTTTPSCYVGNQLSNLNCIDSVSDPDTGFNLIQGCTCPQPCDIDSYIVTVSTAQWPANSYTPTECTQNETGAPWTEAGISCLEWYMKNTVEIEVFYERMNYQTLTESPAYALVNLVSDIGGQVGLFLGMSIISVLEFLTLFVLLLVYCCTYKSRKRDMQEIEMHQNQVQEASKQVAHKQDHEMDADIYDHPGVDHIPPPVMNAP